MTEASDRAAKVLVAGMECTGSTFVWNLVRSLGFTLGRPHHYVESPHLKFVTYRDPRDIICSYTRRQLQDYPELHGLEAGLLESHRRLFQDWRRHEDLRRYRDDECAVLIRYEQYFGGHEGELFDLLVKHLEISVDDARKQQLLVEHSLERVAQRAKELGSFSEYDKVTMVHGKHISSGGRVGVWKELFTPTVRIVVKEDLGDFLVEFGYEKDLNW